MVIRVISEEALSQFDYASAHICANESLVLHKTETDPGEGAELLGQAILSILILGIGSHPAKFRVQHNVTGTLIYWPQSSQSHSTPTLTLECIIRHTTHALEYRSWSRLSWTSIARTPRRWGSGCRQTWGAEASPLAGKRRARVSYVHRRRQYRRHPWHNFPRTAWNSSRPAARRGSGGDAGDVAVALCLCLRRVGAGPARHNSHDDELKDVTWRHLEALGGFAQQTKNPANKKTEIHDCTPEQSLGEGSIESELSLTETVRDKSQDGRAAHLVDIFKALDLDPERLSCLPLSALSSFLRGTPATSSSRLGKSNFRVVVMSALTCTPLLSLIPPRS
eukprot:1857692-Rhodomonas_salina.2